MKKKTKHTKAQLTILENMTKIITEYLINQA